MAFLDWFKTTSSNVKIQNDRIWLNKAAKLKGIATCLVDCPTERNRPGAILLIAHFPDCLDELKKVAEIVERQGAPCPLRVLSADCLPDPAAIGISAGQSQPTMIVVGERHPLLAHDEAVLKFAASLPGRSNVVQHVALDDAVMRSFGGDWVAGTLKRLGMTESESIESQMVTRRIRDAQRKLARESIKELPAESAEAWMELNCPNVWYRDRR
jgi:hypothetical protein